ncbi:MAG: UDP-N-acetylglucosamine 1-carboxyvinyltransferase [Brevefilum sp.]|nr:UDP-N-acetylglucosamine 1-carboxyvinyltransferase [Brevefilum sp.]MDT8381412.1 UDP-N-acetylglucosamine 1-carboxyvinyltransferase [Brevefilum sp.]MDW7754320.1 UDP-N-acetylglucosamine 1-carboxyvinyltransferase [Brevefilum sp.]
MEEFIIQGGIPLHGELIPSGNKNSALPLLASSLLTAEPVIFHNVPNILDVQTMIRLLRSLNVDIKEIGENSIRIDASDIRPADLNPDLCRKIRASILLAGPLISRVGEIYLPPPGGDVIGRRRVDTHILAFSNLGVETRYADNQFHMQTTGLTGAEILMDEASVTATENAIMASVLAKGHSVIKNAASEPHIQQLCHFLNSLGAKIENIGSNTLHIEGVDYLTGGEFTIGPDYLEVVSYIGAAVVTRGSIRVKNAGVEHLDMIRLVMKRLGVSWEVEGNDIIVPENQVLEIEPDLGNAIPEISVMPWPAFPTDLMSIAIIIATQSKGSILFHDWMYPSRMYFTDKLVGMGAQIVLCDPHRCIVQGPTRLNGEHLESPDIRAGMALLIAALSAKGESVIRNVGQIDRGYQEVDKKLKSLGAQIERRTV